jgi:hypothetical protein
LSARAQTRLARRDLDAALADFDAVIPILEKVIGAEREFTLLARACRAMTLGFLGRLGEAQKEIDLVAPLVGQQPKLEALNARVAQYRGTLLRLGGDARAGLEWQEKVLAGSGTLPKLQRERMRAYAEKSRALLALKQIDGAAAAAERSLAEFKKLEAVMTPAHAEALVTMGEIRLAQNRRADARELLAQADDFWRKFDADNAAAGQTAAFLRRLDRAGTP